MAKPDHTLAFVTDHKGQLFVHADVNGLTLLIRSLERVRSKVAAGECEHDHLHTDAWAGTELSESKGCEMDGDIIHHVKISGWTSDAAMKNGFVQ